MEHLKSFFKRIDEDFIQIKKVVDDVYVYNSTDVLVQTVWELPIVIQWPQAKVSFEFTSDPIEIDFGILFIAAPENDVDANDLEIETIEEVSRVQTNDGNAFSGHFVVPSEGVVFFVWDNQFDWSSNKKISYLIEVEEPSFTIPDSIRVNSVIPMIKDVTEDMQTCYIRYADAQDAVEHNLANINFLEDQIAELKSRLETKTHELHSLKTNISKFQRTVDFASQTTMGLCIRSITKHLTSLVLSYLNPQGGANLVCKYWSDIMASNRINVPNHSEFTYDFKIPKSEVASRLRELRKNAEILHEKNRKELEQVQVTLTQDVTAKAKSRKTNSKSSMKPTLQSSSNESVTVNLQGSIGKPPRGGDGQRAKEHSKTVTNNNVHQSVLRTSEAVLPDSIGASKGKKDVSISFDDMISNPQMNALRMYPVSHAGEVTIEKDSVKDTGRVPKVMNDINSVHRNNRDLTVSARINSSIVQESATMTAGSRLNEGLPPRHPSLNQQKISKSHDTSIENEEPTIKLDSFIPKSTAPLTTLNTKLNATMQTSKSLDINASSLKGTASSAERILKVGSNDTSTSMSHGLSTSASRSISRSNSATVLKDLDGNKLIEEATEDAMMENARAQVMSKSSSRRKEQSKAKGEEMEPVVGSDNMNNTSEAITSKGLTREQLLQHQRRTSREEALLTHIQKIRSEQQLDSLLEYIQSGYIKIEGITNEKRRVKKLIKAYIATFEKKHGRAPNSTERKGNLRELYEEYQQLLLALKVRNEKMIEILKSVGLSREEFEELRDKRQLDW